MLSTRVVPFTMKTFTSHSSYEKISNKADEELNLQSDSTDFTERNSFSQYITWQLVWLSLKAFFVTSYIIIIILYLWGRDCNLCLLGQEAIYNDPPILYEDVKFQRTGFHDLAHTHRTMYEGRPNVKNNDAWARLMSGMNNFDPLVNRAD